MSIRGKLTFMACVVLLAVAAVTGTTYVRVGAMVNEVLNGAGTEIVSGAAQTVREKFRVISEVVRTSSGALENAVVEQGLAESDVEKVAMAVLRDNKENGFSDIYFGYEADGHLADGTGWQEPEDFDARKRTWFQQASAAPKGELVFSDPYLDMVTKQMVVAGAKAVYGPDGALLGVSAGDVSISGIGTFVANLSIFGQGAGFLLKKDGVVVAHKDQSLVLKHNMSTDSNLSPSARSFAGRMTKGEAGFCDYEHDGEARRVFFAPVGYGYSLGIFFPASIIDGMVHGLTVLLLVMAGVALVICGALIWTITRGLNRDISVMEGTSAKLGRGDLTARFDGSGKDELSRISRALNAMVTSVADVLRQIKTESEATSRQAETLAALSEETLASMEEVSASVDRVTGVISGASAAVEETNASVEEIAASAQATANNAGEGAERASQVTAVSRDTVTEVGNMLERMREARNTSSESIDQMRELGRAVEAISSFVSSITSIADQTNLLALNAAIEAARAGDAGRGFAVVAEEVRKLAEESAQAAQEVSKLMATLESRSSQSIEATESTERLLVETVETAGSTQEKLQGAMEAMRKLNETIQNIAAVAEEQAASSEEITTAVQNVADANHGVLESTETIGASTKETTRAAESIAQESQVMAATAEKLRTLVDSFTLEGAPAVKR